MKVEAGTRNAPRFEACRRGTRVRRDGAREGIVRWASAAGPPPEREAPGFADRPHERGALVGKSKNVRKLSPWQELIVSVFVQLRRAELSPYYAHHPSLLPMDVAPSQPPFPTGQVEYGDAFARVSGGGQTRWKRLL